jgi:uncharacterized membrane protein
VIRYSIGFTLGVVTLPLSVITWSLGLHRGLLLALCVLVICLASIAAFFGFLHLSLRAKKEVEQELGIR